MCPYLLLGGYSYESELDAPFFWILVGKFTTKSYSSFVI